MRELRTQPKSDYMKTESWQQLYALTEHWKSNLDFYKDNLHFLQELVEKYFFKLIREGDMQHMQTISSIVLDAISNEKEISDRVVKHLSVLESLIEGRAIYGEQTFRNKHIQLEDDIAEFNSNFRKLKNKVFTIMGYALQEEHQVLLRKVNF